MSKVSMIVPVYNSEKYLKEALDCLVNQTLKDIEIIIVDDCSLDNSSLIIKDYMSRYSNIKYHRNDKNMGPGYSRNIGIDMASGEYIGFMDSDDLIDLSMLEAMYNGAISNNKPDLITCGIKFLEPNTVYKQGDRYIDKGRIIDNNKNPDNIIFSSPSCCNKLFKRELIGNDRFLEGCMWEDFAFSFSMLIKANKVLEFSNNLYVYRKDINNGISSRAYKNTSPIEDTFRIGKYLEDSAILYDKYDIYKDVIKLLQISVCLERLSEIKCWNVSEEEKKEKMICLYKETCNRYGSIDDVDKALLSSRVDIMLVDKTKEIISNKGKSM